jgi:hypothetical protein
MADYKHHSEFENEKHKQTFLYPRVSLDCGNESYPDGVSHMLWFVSQRDSPTGFALLLTCKRSFFHG